MKAIQITQYGSPDVLKLKEITKPNPKENEILIKIHASSVTYGDLLARNFKAVTPKTFNMPSIFLLPARMAFGFSKPKINIMGAELAGEVEAVGKDVTRFKKGDQVFGYPGQSMGAYAEYICMVEDAPVALKPVNMTYEEAAVIPYGAIMALSLLRRANIQPGQKVLINGASGGIGSAAVQIAKYFGAEVTGVCGTPRLAFVKSLGADHVIDYTNEDFTKNGKTYNVIFDVLGKSSFSQTKRSLTPNGIQFYASFKTPQLLQMMWTSMFGAQKVICGMAPGSLEDLMIVKDLIEAGKIKSIIDKSFPLEQAAEAHTYLENGMAQGKIAIHVTS